MDVLWEILVQFIFRLTFGVALAMAITPPSLVTSGFYRIHLWVLMGLNTLASLALYSRWNEAAAPETGTLLGLALALAVTSYVGSVIWLYEKPLAGRIVLALITAVALGAAWMDQSTGARDDTLATGLFLLTAAGGGWLLGTTMTAMLLGHWYLNTPSMQLGPLRRLIACMMGAIVVQAVLSAAGLSLLAAERDFLSSSFWIFYTFRGSAGILGAGLMAWMAWQTLKVPNTQSATGILYAGVVLVFLGELVAQLLSVESAYPV